MANVIKQAINPSNFSVSLRPFVTIPNSLDPQTGTLRPPRLNYITHAGDDTGRLYVNDQRGKMYIISPQGRLLGTFLDLKSQVGLGFEVNGSEKGFTYFTFHPEYKTNGLFYTIHSEVPTGNPTFSYVYPYTNDKTPTKHHDVLTEWRDNNPVDNVFRGTRREILRIEQPYADHNTGQIGFNPTATPGSPDYGNLYIAVGDGGLLVSKETTFSGKTKITSQDLSSPLGKILRINPQGNNSRNRRYGIPRDNPTHLRNGNPNALPEIYSYGHRNPHRFSWDLNTGKMLLAEIGQGSIEEVNLILPGRNYGWAQREGYYQPVNGQQFPLNNPDGFTYPVAQYDHDFPGAAIAGGYVYQGSAIPYLRNQYIFADFSRDSRWFVAPSQQMELGKLAPIERLRIIQNGREVSFLDILRTPRSDVRFGTDENNELYVTNKQDGIIRQLVPSVEYLNRNPAILVQEFQIDEGNRVRYPITLVGAINTPVTVSYNATSNSAQLLGDFPPIQGTVRFNPSSQNHQTQYITVPTTQDNLGESNEKFWLNWRTNPTIPIKSRTEITILNNDHNLIIGGSTRVREGETFNIPLNLAGAVNEVIEINYTLRNGTANINDDLLNRTTGRVIFDPREPLTGKSISLRTRQDNLVERDEVFWVDFSSPQTRINQRVQLTVINDDSPRINTFRSLNLSHANQIPINPLNNNLEMLGLANGDNSII